MVHHFDEYQQFLCLRATLAWRKSVRTLQMWSTWPCGDTKRITMSSRCTQANCHFTVDRMTSIVCSNVPRALRYPKDLRMSHIVCGWQLRKRCPPRPLYFIAHALVSVLKMKKARPVTLQVTTQCRSWGKVGIANQFTIEKSSFIHVDCQVARQAMEKDNCKYIWIWNRNNSRGWALNQFNKAMTRYLPIELFRP